jgi:hypothetical protein
MRNSLAIAAMLAFFATGALAQSQNTPAADGPQNCAVNPSDSSTPQPTAPVAGRNAAVNAKGA